MSASAEHPPLVSVVIPAYKARNYLSQALDSVAAQTCTDWEILVIDDQSPEPIDDILTEFSLRMGLEIRFIRHEKNQGLGGARNTGIREARGEWIALLDHDDLWVPDHLESLVRKRDQTNADLVFCTTKQFREDPEDELGYWGPKPDDENGITAMAILRRSFITPSATLIRRSLLLDCDGFSTDPRVHMCEDQDLWLRLLERDARFAHVRKPTCYYRKHNEAATARLGYMSYQSAYVVHHHAPKVEGPWFERRALVSARWWQAWLAFLKMGHPRWDVLMFAIWTGLPVPWEIARGTMRSLRCLATLRTGIRSKKQL